MTQSQVNTLTFICQRTQIVCRRIVAALTCIGPFYVDLVLSSSSFTIWCQPDLHFLFNICPSDVNLCLLWEVYYHTHSNTDVTGNLWIYSSSVAKRKELDKIHWFSFIEFLIRANKETQRDKKKKSYLNISDIPAKVNSSLIIHLVINSIMAIYVRAGLQASGCIVEMHHPLHPQHHYSKAIWFRIWYQTENDGEPSQKQKVKGTMESGLTFLPHGTYTRVA